MATKIQVMDRQKDIQTEIREVHAPYNKCFRCSTHEGLVTNICCFIPTLITLDNINVHNRQGKIIKFYLCFRISNTCLHHNAGCPQPMQVGFMAEKEYNDAFTGKKT